MIGYYFINSQSYRIITTSVFLISEARISKTSVLTARTPTYHVIIDHMIIDSLAAQTTFFHIGTI